VHVQLHTLLQVSTCTLAPTLLGSRVHVQLHTLLQVSTCTLAPTLPAVLATAALVLARGAGAAPPPAASSTRGAARSAGCWGAAACVGGVYVLFQGEERDACLCTRCVVRASGHRGSSVSSVDTQFTLAACPPHPPSLYPHPTIAWQWRIAAYWCRCAAIHNRDDAWRSRGCV